jgi:putative serine protease PepD
MGHPPLRAAVIALAVAATLGVPGSSHSANSLDASSTARAVEPTPAAAALEQTFVAVYRAVSPSVVQISTSEGLGSGIIFDKSGNIVTNDHVVGTATAFSVTTSTGKRLKGSLVGRFTPDDLAVIKVNGSGLRPATFADSSKLRVGDIAMAVGNPLGLSSSVTEGIVSALNRQETEGNGITLPNTIQTSAPINPGNSGGALVDIHARVIGIPTLAARDPQLGGAAAGIGFAIPSDVVTDIAGQIIKNRHVINSHRAYLAITVGDTGGNGVYVGSVTPGGPGSKAGITAGDVIVSVNGTPTPTPDDLSASLAGLKPGQSVAIKLVHQSGATRSVRVILGQYPGS